MWQVGVSKDETRRRKRECLKSNDYAVQDLNSECSCLRDQVRFNFSPPSIGKISLCFSAGLSSQAPP